MANIKKYTQKQVPHLFDHVARGPDDEHDRSNAQIDPSLTHLNHDLVTGAYAGDNRDPHEQYERLESILSQKVILVNLAARTDVNVAACCVIQVPPEVPENRLEEFFSWTYDFLRMKFGAQNVVSCWIHLDETTPHMHFIFVPCVKERDEKTGAEVERLCASECINRKMLKDFHPQLQHYIDQRMGMHVSIMNGATVSGNKTILELKNQELERNNTALKAQLTVLAAQETLYTVLIETNSDIRRILVEIECYMGIKEWNEEQQQKIGSFHEDFNTLPELIRHAQVEVSKVINSANSFEKTFSEEIADARKKAMDAYQKSIAKADKVYQEYRKRLSAMEIEIEQKVKLRLENPDENESRLYANARRREGCIQQLDRMIFEREQQIETLKAEEKALSVEILAARERIHNMQIKAEQGIQEAVEKRTNKVLLKAAKLRDALQFSDSFLHRYQLCCGTEYQNGGGDDEFKRRVCPHEYDH